MTAKELADKLGVPLIHTPRPLPPLKQKDDSENSFARRIKEMSNDTVAVCETCSKEIKRLDRKSPCGNNQCPFGHLQNY